MSARKEASKKENDVLVKVKRCTVWVSPTAAITESDIEQAQPEVREDGYRVIRVVFTDAGTNKLHDLTAAQLKKLIAMVVDDKLVWAPMVTAPTPMAKSFPTANTGTLAALRHRASPRRSRTHHEHLASRPTALRLIARCHSFRAS